MQLTEDEKALIEEIDAAFKHVPHYGKDIGLSHEITEFVGKTRDEITLVDICRTAWYLDFFSAKAMRYFMSCFLTLPFLDRATFKRSDLPDNLLRFFANPDRLICVDGYCRSNEAGRQLKQFFSPDERAAIVAFLRQYGASFPVKYRFRYDRKAKGSPEEQRQRLEHGAKRRQHEQNELIIAAMDYWMTPPNESFKSPKAGKNKKRA
jgi:hypothetical protein